MKEWSKFPGGTIYYKNSSDFPKVHLKKCCAIFARTDRFI